MADSPYAPSSERYAPLRGIPQQPQRRGGDPLPRAEGNDLGPPPAPVPADFDRGAFIGEIPRVPFIMPGTVELADAAGAAAARDAPAVIMQNHGLIVGGQNLRHASDMTLIIEQTADKLIACHMLGKTRPSCPTKSSLRSKNLGEMII